MAIDLTLDRLASIKPHQQQRVLILLQAALWQGNKRLRITSHLADAQFIPLRLIFCRQQIPGDLLADELIVKTGMGTTDFTDATDSRDLSDE